MSGHLHPEIWSEGITQREMRRREVFQRLAEQKESRIEEGRLIRDLVPTRIATTELRGAANHRGYSEGKTRRHLNQARGQRKWNLAGQRFGRRVVRVSRVSRDENFAALRRFQHNLITESLIPTCLGGIHASLTNSF